MRVSATAMGTTCTFPFAKAVYIIVDQKYKKTIPGARGDIFAKKGKDRKVPYRNEIQFVHFHFDSLAPPVASLGCVQS